jgi:hypothetical protein
MNMDYSHLSPRERWEAEQKEWEAKKKAKRQEQAVEWAKDRIAREDALREVKAEKLDDRMNLLDAAEGRKLLTLSPAPARWLVDGLIPIPGTATVFGHAGVGKSRLLYDLGYHVALGKPWHGAAVRQGNVLIFTDSSPELIARTMDSIGAEVGEPDWRRVPAFNIVDGLPEVIEGEIVFERQYKRGYIRDWIQAIEPFPIMVGVDPLSGVRRTSKDHENAALLSEMSDSFAGTLLVTHRLTGRDDNQFKSLHRLSNAVVQREITVERDRIGIHRGASSITLAVLPPDARRLLELIPTDGPIPRNKVREAFNRDAEAFNKAEAALFSAGRIEKLPDWPPKLRRVPLLLPAS